MKRTIIFGGFSLMVIFAACKKEDPTAYDCNGLTPTYTNGIKTILDANCTSSGCHNSKDKKDGLDFSNYAAASAGSKEADFLGAIQHKSGYMNMPKGKSKLDEETIKKITCWVQNGSPE